MDKNNAHKIYDILAKEYPKATTALVHEDPLQLLVATILSAQCTDARVNIVTKTLFKKYRNAKAYANAKPKELEQDIHSTGFYRNKAKNIIGAAKKIVGEFDSRVPNTMEELIQLPGVARKTANIVLFHAFGKNGGIAVDTHVTRVAYRLGLTKNVDPVKIEQDLMPLFDKKDWGRVNSLIVSHGRAVCVARKPLCSECVLNKICPKIGVA